jgi:hypothetical protein
LSKSQKRRTAMSFAIEVSGPEGEAMAGWLNVARMATKVRRGDRISVAVEGGFVHKEAPCDGTVYDSTVGSVFVPVGATRGGLSAVPSSSPQGEGGPADAGE